MDAHDAQWKTWSSLCCGQDCSDVARYQGLARSYLHVSTARKSAKKLEHAGVAQRLDGTGAVRSELWRKRKQRAAGCRQGAGRRVAVNLRDQARLGAIGGCSRAGTRITSSRTILRCPCNGNDTAQGRFAVGGGVASGASAAERECARARTGSREDRLRRDGFGWNRPILRMREV